MTFLSLLAATVVAFAEPGGRDGDASVVVQRQETLVRRILDPAVPPSERNMLLSSLERSDFSRAMKVAPVLLGAGDGFLRARAAWILAAGGDEIGRQALRTLAAERIDASVNAISALGRLRDAEAHKLLRRLLEVELASSDKADRSRVLALTGSLGDYFDPSDAALLARTIERKYGSGYWVNVTDTGRTGGRGAIPVLEDVFRYGRGWTVMAAGLAAARCGSPEGLQYVRKWLATPAEMSDQRENFMSNAESDDPHGGKAMDFILSQLGVPADEVFLPELLALANRTEYSRAKAQAWQALLRMNPAKDRQQILEMAWENAGFFDSASRLIVLNQEALAREFVRSHAGSEDREERRKASKLAETLRASYRQRLDWRIIHGYAF